jgi:hypothetical protein
MPEVGKSHTSNTVGKVSYHHLEHSEFNATSIVTYILPSTGTHTRVAHPVQITHMSIDD